jgi:hypothetical protein
LTAKGLEEDKEKGFKTFGRWFKNHRADSALWPESLRQWFAPQLEQGKRLQQRDICLWLAESSTREDDVLGMPVDVSDYLYRVKCIEGWPKGDFKGQIDLWFGEAIAASRFLSINGRRVSTVRTLVNVLSGELDPFDKSIRLIEMPSFSHARLQGIVQTIMAVNNLSLEEFSLEQWDSREMVEGGELYRLLEGTLDEPLSQIILDKVAYCLNKHLNPTDDWDAYTVRQLIDGKKGIQEEIPSSHLVESELMDFVYSALTTIGRTKEDLGFSSARLRELDLGAQPTPLEFKKISKLSNFAISDLLAFWNDQYGQDHLLP